MASNPYDSPSLVNESQDRNRANSHADSLYLAIAFVLFSFGIVLPLLYGVGRPYFEGVGMSLPIFTGFLMQIPPSGMIVFSVLVSVGIFAMRNQLNGKTSRLTAWLVIGFTAAMTLIGVLAFLSPLFSVVSAL